MSASVIVYTKQRCPFCDSAKKLLQGQHIPFEERPIDQNQAWLQDMSVVTQGKKTVPQIVIHGVSVGGYDELLALYQSGQLESLLKG